MLLYILCCAAILKRTFYFEEVACYTIDPSAAEFSRRRRKKLSRRISAENGIRLGDRRRRKKVRRLAEYFIRYINKERSIIVSNNKIDQFWRTHYYSSQSLSVQEDRRQDRS